MWQPPTHQPFSPQETGVKRPAAPSFAAQDPHRTFHAPDFSSAYNDRFNEFVYRAMSAKHELRISDTTQFSLLYGASLCGHQPATEAPLTGVKILTAPTEAAAQIVIVQALEAMNYPFHNLSSAQIKAMKSFAISWLAHSPPQGLSVFCNQIWCHNGNANSDLLIIDVKRDYNREISDQEITKLTKNHIIVPKTYTDTLRAMQTQYHLLKMFFGHDSYLCSTYADFLTDFQAMAIYIERSIAVDDRFSTYLLLRVDAIIRKIVFNIVHSPIFSPKHFLGLSELRRILEEIDNERFTCPLIPSWISSFENSKSEIEIEKTPKTPGKPGKDKDKKREMIRKESGVLPRIKVSEDEFKTHIKNKHLKSRPKACIRWHTRGWCFAGCSSLKTHDHLSKKDEDEIYDFLVKVGVKK